MKKESEMRSCPTDDLLEEAFSNRMSDEEKESLVDHIFTCPQCRIKFEALKTARIELLNYREAIPEDPLTRAETKAFIKMARQRLREIPGQEGPKPSFVYRNRAVLAAAAVLCPLILTALFVFKPFSEKGIFRDAANIEFRLLEPQGTIKSPPARFRWTDYPNSDGYNVLIVDENLQTVMTAKETTSSYALKDDPTKIFERGKYYFWSVTAKSDDGIPLAIARGSFLIKGPTP